MHLFRRRHRRFLFVLLSQNRYLFLTFDYYSSRSTQLMWQQNVLCYVKGWKRERVLRAAGRSREKKTRSKITGFLNRSEF